MPWVKYLPDGKKVELEEGETLLKAALWAGIPLAHVCGGSARCSTCRVIILQGLTKKSLAWPKEKNLSQRENHDHLSDHRQWSGR
ncbi:MAG: 2Fe-2S iron-sulfur cluster-binding protein [Thermodesulfobacteriota bacterium]